MPPFLLLPPDILQQISKVFWYPAGIPYSHDKIHIPVFRFLPLPEDLFLSVSDVKRGEKMINREIVYERNLTGSFMKIAAGIHAGLDEKLMLRRKLPGLLAVEKAYMDGEGQYWYNISGKQSLDMYCRVKEVDISFIEKLIMSICSEMEILEWNLLPTYLLSVFLHAPHVLHATNQFLYT